MLSMKDLQHYCRTCLVKLESSHDDGSGKSIATKKNPEIEHLIQVCLTKATAGDDSLCVYVPFLCRSCYSKWLDFVKLYQLAVESDDKIRKILEKEVLKNDIEDKDENQQTIYEEYKYDKYFLDTEDLVDIREMEICAASTQLFTEIKLNNQIPNEINREIMPFAENKNPDLEEGSDDQRNNDMFNSSSGSSCLDEKSYSSKNKKRTKGNRNTTTSKCVLRKKYKTRKSNLKSSIESEIPRPQLNANEDENALRKIRYQCEECKKYFWEKKRFEGHMKLIHEGIKRPFQCNQCDKAYNLYKTLMQHKREYHSEKSQETFKCDQCDKVFKTAIILKQHVTNKHSEQKEAMRSICDQCGFIAAHQYSLARHILNKHTETDQIKCDQCPKVFKTRYSLKYHILGNHNPLNIKPFKCSECQMGFTRKTLLNQHKRTHLTYTERIKCDFEGCEVRFVKRGDKTHHMRLVHLKVKQHICDFCGEAFGAMQTLRHHRFIHTGEKPYKCNVCGQGFRQRTAMKTHRKTHFGKESNSHDVINNLTEVNLSLVNT